MDGADDGYCVPSPAGDFVRSGRGVKMEDDRGFVQCAINLVEHCAPVFQVAYLASSYGRSLCFRFCYTGFGHHGRYGMF